MRYFTSFGQFVHILLICAVFCSVESYAQVVLVVKANFPYDCIQLEDLRALWLGEKRTIGELGRIRVVDLHPSHQLHQQFYSDIIGLTGKNLEIHWKKKMFVGRVFRPKQVQSIKEAVELVRAVPGVIAYIDKPHLNDDLDDLKELCIFR